MYLDDPFVIPYVVHRRDTQSERLGLAELPPRTIPILNKHNAWDVSWGSRGDRAATCLWCPYST